MKTVFITGASGGIGSATARIFKTGGYFPFIGYNSSESQAKALERELGGIAVKCDVTDPESVERAFEFIEEKAIPDVVVSNAGISHIGLLTDMSEDDWHRVTDVNLGGAFRVTKAAAKLMLRHHRGAIINVSSIWGEVGASCEAAYSAAKAGVIGLTRAMAKELGPSGIRVNCVSPGVIDTKMNAELTHEDRLALADDTPLGRLGTPRDVAEAIYYLAEARFVTGQVLGVNGGFVV